MASEFQTLMLAVSQVQMERKPMKFFQLFMTILACLVLVPKTGLGQKLELKNADFSQWGDDLPEAWKVEIGLGDSGRQPHSTLKPGEDGSIILSGNAETVAWKAISQTVPIKSGKSYRLKFTARVDGVQKEGEQIGNCYVAIAQMHERGQVLRQDAAKQISGDFLEQSVTIRAHNFASAAEVKIFLSQTGTLEVKDISLELLQPADSFKILVEEMDRYYSYFEHKDIDWKGLTEKYRERLEGASGTSFVDHAADMLAEIKDAHIWLEHRRLRTSKYFVEVQPNYDFAVVEEDLVDPKAFGMLGVTGMTPDGFGYVRITSLAIEQPVVERMKADIVERMFECPGIIIDLRKNQGGSERLGKEIASLFTDKEVLYAKSKHRAGLAHDSFFSGPDRFLQPAEMTYTKPVVCLTGPGAVSSGEAFAMMLKAISHVRLIGQPTRGSSGSPAAVHLPNGVDVWFSRWVSMLPDGTPIEDDGVPPDETVAHADGDATYARAVQWLKTSSK